MTLVEDNLPRRVQLLQEVEVIHVACKDRHSVFPCRGKDESVIQHSSPVGRSIALEAGENPRQNSRNQPGLSIRREGAMRRPAFDDCNDLPGCLNGGGMTRIQETAWCDQFGFRDRGMPRIRGANRKFAGFRETALEDVHVNRRVVKQ